MATGVADCYYNVVDLPAGGSFRFRVACVNKAGQGPYSSVSQLVRLEPSGRCFQHPDRTGTSQIKVQNFNFVFTKIDLCSFFSTVLFVFYLLLF